MYERRRHLYLLHEEYCWEFHIDQILTQDGAVLVKGECSGKLRSVWLEAYHALPETQFRCCREQWANMRLERVQAECPLIDQALSRHAYQILRNILTQSLPHHRQAILSHHLYPKNSIYCPLNCLQEQLTITKNMQAQQRLQLQYLPLPSESTTHYLAQYTLLE